MGHWGRLPNAEAGNKKGYKKKGRKIGCRQVHVLSQTPGCCQKDRKRGLKPCPEEGGFYGRYQEIARAKD